MSGDLVKKLAFVKEMLAYDMANAGASDSAIAIMKAQIDRYISYAKMGMTVEAMPDPQSGNDSLDELVVLILTDLVDDQGEVAVVQNGGAVPTNGNGSINGVQAGYGYYYYYPNYWYNWYYGYNNYWGGYYNRWYPYYYWNYYTYAGAKRSGQAQNGIINALNGNGVPNAQGNMNAIQNAVNAISAQVQNAVQGVQAQAVNALPNGLVVPNGAQNGIPNAQTRVQNGLVAVNGNASRQLPKVVDSIDKRLDSAHLTCNANGDCNYNATFKALDNINVNEGHLTCNQDNLCTYTIRFKRQ